MTKRRRVSTAGGRGVLGALALAAAVIAAAPASADLSSASDATAWVTDGSVLAVAHGAGRTYIGGKFTHIGPRTGPGAPIGASGAVAGPFPEVAGGEVSAVASDGANGWYIGGDFTSVGGDKDAKFIAHIKSDGTVDGGFKPLPDGPVRAIVVGTQAPDAGVVYFGGEFTKVHGLPRAHAAAVDGSGTTLAWNPAPDNNVYAAAEAYIPQQQADAAKTIVTIPVVFIGGAFKNAGAGSPQQNAGISPVWGVGSVDPGTATTAAKSNSGAAPAWNFYGNTTEPGTVRALALDVVPPTDPTDPNAKATIAVYGGGDFATPGVGLAARRFQAAMGPTTTSPPARNIAAVATYSTWTSSVAVDCPAAVTPCTKTVRALTRSGPALYVGGEFGKVGTGADAQPRLTSVSAIDDPSNTSAPAATASGWNQAPDGPVRAIAAAGDRVYVAGSFTKIGETSRTALAAIDAASGAPLSDWDARAAGPPASKPTDPVTANALALNGSTLYAGGSFTSLGAREVRRLAALDANGVPDASFAASADDGAVQALALSPDESTLYVGGGFTSVNGSTRHRLAALDPATGGVRDNFKPDLDGWALALDAVGSTLYVGGSFTHIGNDPRSHVAALNVADGTPTAFNPGADDSVRAISAACGVVYLGGSFSRVAGTDRGRVAAVTPDGTLTTWNPGDLGTVYALAGAGDAIYVGGSFTLMGGAIRYGIAKVSAATGKASAWNPVAESPSIVRGLAVAPGAGTVYAAGSFVRIGGLDRRRIAALDAVSGAANPAWDPSADGPAYAIVSSGGAVFAGGEFSQLGTTMQQGFGAWNAAAALTSPPAAETCPGDNAGSSGPPAPVVQPVPDRPSAPVTRPVRLVIRSFKAKPARFKAGTPSASTPTKGKKRRGFPTGTTFVFDLSRRAKVRISIHRELFGHRKGKECVAPKAGDGRRCIRYQLYGTLTPGRAAPGRHRLPFTGMFGGKRLPAGIYTAKLTAMSLDGKRRVSRLTRLQVIAP